MNTLNLLAWQPPEWYTGLVNSIVGSAAVFVTLSTVGLMLGMKYYRVLTKPKVAGPIAIVSAFLLFISYKDPQFSTVASLPDNVPIVMMVASVGFFVWLAFRQMALNDERLEQGLPPKEAEAKEAEKTFVWPDLVYIEFICLILFTVFLILWSIALKAPLEQMANPAKTPNPSKAPWYFLGLQEMLVYFDPWIAGVVLPTMIITGLMMLPYIDKNPKGNGYYTFKERKFAISVFMFGFIVTWVLLIFMGTFLRGPNWNFFGPYETWDIHKLEPLTNVNLSELVYLKAFSVGMPHNWFIREIWGILLLLGYFVILPGALVRFVPLFRKFYESLGMVRYSVFIIHVLVMAGMVIKMLTRWTFNLKYVVAIPEYFFNI
ncbi:MAG: hypothetical protein AAB074_18070 [Planctomycetota bacterium]